MGLGESSKMAKSSEVVISSATVQAYNQMSKRNSCVLVQLPRSKLNNQSVRYADQCPLSDLLHEPDSYSLHENLRVLDLSGVIVDANLPASQTWVWSLV